MSLLSIPDPAIAAMTFDGSTYDPVPDQARLGKQLLTVKALMSDGEWRTLPEISALVGAPQQSVSARLRDLRKERFGRNSVARRARGDRTRGNFEYRLEVTA